MGEARRRKLYENRKFFIEEGFAKCYKCDGCGRTYVYDSNGYQYYHDMGKPVTQTCYVCKGSGKLTWLQNIFRGER